MVKAGATLNDIELTKLATQWIWFDRIRFVIMIIGYLFLLKAFRLPYPRNN